MTTEEATNRWLELAMSPALRGTLLFATGLGLTIRESLTNGVDRPSLYVLWGGMMGLSVLQGKGGKKDKDGD